MSQNPDGNVTQFLQAWKGGDPQALEQLMPLVYNELHRIAQYHWGGQRRDHTLQPTVLIHEAFLKLKSHGGAFENRTHFFALASRAMRQVLVNHAKAKLTSKRGGGDVQVPLMQADIAVYQEAESVLALHEALNGLQEIDPRKCVVVELRYFGGLSIEETAEALGISDATVNREWRSARAWLARELELHKGPTA